MVPPDEWPPPSKSILDLPEPAPDGLGEFIDTVLDKDGEVEPEILDEPEEGEKATEE